MSGQQQPGNFAAGAFIILLALAACIPAAVLLERFTQ